MEKSRRENEILTYLENLKGKSPSILILDDEYEGFKKLRKYVLEIDGYYGLQEKHFEQCVKILEAQKRGSK